MIEKIKIEKLVDEFISDKEIFLVGISVSTGNKIAVQINKMSGITIEECVQLSKHIEGNLDREVEDFDLQVSSPGLGEPFQVPEQFEMNLGKKVEVVDYEGNKTNGTLISHTETGFTLETTIKAKGKKRELTEKLFDLDQIRSVRVKISFKQ